MEWATLLAVILNFLGPILRDWLNSLLTRAASEMDDSSGLSPMQYLGGGVAAERALWNRAESLLAQESRDLSWWNIVGMLRASSRRRVFLAARRAAERRPGQFYAEALGYDDKKVAAMTPGEVVSINAAE